MRYGYGYGWLILVLVLVSVVVGFIQERRSEKSLEALNKLVPHHCHIIRYVFISLYIGTIPPLFLAVEMN